mgnify:CR=1 FL=1
MGGEVSKTTVISIWEVTEWDRRDLNSGPTHPMRRGYRYPTVPRIEKRATPD